MQGIVGGALDSMCHFRQLSGKIYISCQNRSSTYLFHNERSEISENVVEIGDGLDDVRDFLLPFFDQSCVVGDQTQLHIGEPLRDKME